MQHPISEDAKRTWYDYCEKKYKVSQKFLQVERSETYSKKRFDEESLKIWGTI